VKACLLAPKHKVVAQAEPVFQKSLDAYTILDAKNPRFVEHSTLFKETCRTRKKSFEN
jgi:hypothetical protein